MLLRNLNPELREAVEKFRSWNGKNYAGSIYVNNEKIMDSRVETYCITKKLQQGWDDFMADNPFSLLNDSRVNAKFLSVRDYICVSAVMNGFVNSEFDNAGLGAQLLKHTVYIFENLIEQKGKDIEDININELIEGSTAAWHEN